MYAMTGQVQLCTYMYLHPECSPELEVGSLLQVLVTNDRVLPVARHSYGEGREDGVLDETSRQFIAQ